MQYHLSNRRQLLSRIRRNITPCSWCILTVREIFIVTAQMDFEAERNKLNGQYDAKVINERKCFRGLATAKDEYRLTGYSKMPVGGRPAV